MVLYISTGNVNKLAKERKIVEAVKSPIVVALKKVGTITDVAEDATNTPIPSPMSGMDSSVINNTFRGHDRYAFMTVLCDHEYLCGIREKIRLIQQFQRDEKTATV